MRRREFLETSSLAVAAAFLPGGIASVLAGESRLRELRPGVGVFTERGGTIGWYVGEGGILVIDTQFPETARHCLDDLRERSPRKIDAVLNTHHHGDHTAGNGVFREAATHIVAHRNVPGLQKAAAEKRGNAADQVYADVLFDDDWKLDLGSESVRGRHFGAAHTGGDAIYHLEKTGVVHMGDLVFHNMVPYVDLPGGSSVQGWIKVLEKAMKSYPKDATYIYGHASEASDVVGPREGLAGMRDYLSGLLDYVRKGKKVGKTAEDLAKVDRIPGFPGHVPMFDGAIKNNVEAAYTELSR